MEKYVITLGDFLKNAGIVGFHYMLETAGAEKEVDFGYTDDNQAMWVSMDYAQNADWTDMYFKAFIRYFGPFSTYQGIKDKIQSCLEKIESENWNSGKQEKEDLKFIMISYYQIAIRLVLQIFKRGLKIQKYMRNQRKINSVIS